jgi:hypothetical protein
MDTWHCPDNCPESLGHLAKDHAVEMVLKLDVAPIEHE